MAAPSRDPISLPVWAVNRCKASVAVPGCLQLTAAPRRFSPDTAHRLLSTTGCECPSCLHWGDRLSSKLNHHSWGKIYWIMNNSFSPPHNVNIYLLAVTMPKGISCLMKLTEMLCKKATNRAEWHLFTELLVIAWVPLGPLMVDGVMQPLQSHCYCPRFTHCFKGSWDASASKSEACWGWGAMRWLKLRIAGEENQPTQILITTATDTRQKAVTLFVFQSMIFPVALTVTPTQQKGLQD